MPDLPPPPVSPEADLRSFPYLPLDVVRLRDSRLSATASGEEFRAAVLLWCASWHQLPAGSLPDDDSELASLAGFGRDKKAWKKVRANAMHGWAVCSDGRLYHAVIAEKAREAWESKKAQRERTEAARRAREASRGDCHRQHTRSVTSSVTDNVASSVTDTVTASNITEHNRDITEQIVTAAVAAVTREASATAATAATDDPMGKALEAMDQAMQASQAKSMSRAEVQATNRVANPLDWLVSHPKCFAKDQEERRAWGALIQRYADHGQEGMDTLHEIYQRAVAKMAKDGHKRIFLSWFADYANDETDWENEDEGSET